MNDYVLGIHDGHNASAALVEGGDLIFAVQEERLVGRKNFYGFPVEAVRACLSFAGIEPADVSHIALASLRQTPARHRSYDQLAVVRRESSLSGFLWRGLVWYPVYRYGRDLGWRERKASLRALGFSAERCRRYEHHLVHAATAYFGMREDASTPYLVITMDGFGDVSSCTVWIGENGKLTLVSRTPFTSSLGSIYANTTGILGFTPQEHEYKLMGMAAYVPDEDAQRAAEQFCRLIDVDEDQLVIRRSTFEPTFSQQRRLQQIIGEMRFDSVCAGVQVACERILAKFVRAAIRRTGIRRVLCAGGVFMNVKANKVVMELPEVDYLAIPPSCGDESMSLGAAWYDCVSRGRVPADAVKPLHSPYLGPDVSQADADAVVKASGHEYSRPPDIETEVARLLAAGEPIARCAGRLEFGARALGNRSIIADPINQDVVRVINRMVKKRDFWMPFAPVVSRARMHEYIKNPKNLPSPYMMLSFDTKENFRHLIAAVHNADLTARVQILPEDQNPAFTRILDAFAAVTQRGALLNTSFNLHGHPIVRGPAEAMAVFNNSGLTHLVLGPYLLHKRPIAEDRALPR
jgi:carbamoyltransferase